MCEYAEIENIKLSNRKTIKQVKEENYMNTKHITFIRLLSILMCVIMYSCTPSREEKALEVFCRTEGPQSSNLYSNVSIEECYFFDNLFSISSISVDTRQNVVGLDILSTKKNTELVKELFSSISQGEKILLNMASSNKRLKIIFDQIQKLGYTLEVTINLSFDDVIVFNKEIISKWNIK